jgi:tRNA-2-methylthio-N6-dimethylallyladenosine synthase
MPLQSGSDKVLKAMRRAYRRDRYLAILDNVRAHIPHAAITTDIIVGFPGETEQDFAETLDLVSEARFSSAFTFQYSIRAGTPAATMPDQVPQPVVQERYDRLVALVEQVATDENAKQDGTVVEVLVAEGEGRKDAATHRLSGRARDNRLVHFAPHGTVVPRRDDPPYPPREVPRRDDPPYPPREVPRGDDPASPLRAPRPGDIVTTRVTSTAPHYLRADDVPLSVRRTRAGDAWEARQHAAAAPASAGPAPVLLGMPARRG